MLNLAPEAHLKAVKRDYYLRLVAVALFLLSAAFGVGMLLLVPSYVSVEVKTGALLAERTQLEESLAAQGTDDLDAFLAETNERVATVAALSDEAIVHDDVTSLLNVRPDGVRVHSLAYTTEGDGARKIVVRGRGMTRESVVRFEERITDDPIVTSVDLPLSELARSENIEFTMTVNLAPTTEDTSAE